MFVPSLLLQVGHAHFPDDPFMVLAMANFLIFIQKSNQVREMKGVQVRLLFVLFKNHGGRL